MKVFLLAAGAIASAALLWSWCGSPSDVPRATGEANCSNAVIDWVEVFQVDGVRYYGSFENRDVMAPIGPEVARVQFNVRANVCDLNYRLKDGDATFLLVGTPIYAVEGYDPKQVLAANAWVHEARPEGGAVGGDQLPFEAEAVQRIAILSQFDAAEVAAVEEPAQVQAFVQAALEALVEGETAGDWDYFVEFQLKDGLRFRRTYNSLTGNLREGIRVPEAAQQVVRDALQ